MRLHGEDDDADLMAQAREVHGQETPDRASADDADPLDPTRKQLAERHLCYWIGNQKNMHCNEASYAALLCEFSKMSRALARLAGHLPVCACSSSRRQDERGISDIRAA